MTQENTDDSPETPAQPGVFWDWSMDVYTRTGVAERLLRLQDECGLNVNLILWCLWAGDHFTALKDQEVVSLVRLTEEWSDRITQPLRGVRRWIKGRDLPGDSEATNELRQGVKALELDAEKISQSSLNALTRQNADADYGEIEPERARHYFHKYLAIGGHLDTVGSALENAGELGEKEKALVALFDEIADLAREGET